MHPVTVTSNMFQRHVTRFAFGYGSKDRLSGPGWRHGIRKQGNCHPGLIAWSQICPNSRIVRIKNSRIARIQIPELKVVRLHRSKIVWISQIWDNWYPNLRFLDTENPHTQVVDHLSIRCVGVGNRVPNNLCRFNRTACGRRVDLRPDERKGLDL